jgi:hypothetical protein
LIVFLERSNIKFHQNPSNGNRVGTCGRDEANWRFLQFCGYSLAVDTSEICYKTMHHVTAKINHCTATFLYLLTPVFAGYQYTFKGKGLLYDNAVSFPLC